MGVSFFPRLGSARDRLKIFLPNSVIVVGGKLFLLTPVSFDLKELGALVTWPVKKGEKRRVFLCWDPVPGSSPPSD